MVDTEEMCDAVIEGQQYSVKTVRTTAIGKRRHLLTLLWPAEDMKMSQP